MLQKQFAVVCPAYNEAKALKYVISDLDSLECDYVIVDDGSTDKTPDILDVVCPFNSMTYAPNRGKGHAIKLGAKYVINNGAEWVLIMDADGQCFVGDIDAFYYASILNPDAKIIIGNRFPNAAKMPRLRYHTNRFMSWLLSKMIGQHVPDTQCGFRLVHKDVFEKLRLNSERFEFESEMLVEAGRAGMKILSVPIHCIYILGRESKIHPIKDTIRFVKLLWRLLRKK